MYRFGWTWTGACLCYVALSTSPGAAQQGPAAPGATAISTTHSEATPSTASAIHRVSLSALLKAGRGHHPTLAKRPLLAKSLAEQRAQANASYFPQLSLGGSATWQSDVPHVDAPIPGVDIGSPPKDQYKLTLDLQQLLWDGGATEDRKKLVERQAQLEQGRVAVEWREVHTRIVQLYFAGVMQQQLRAQARALNDYLATTVEKAELSLSMGVVTERDVLLARARKLEARQALVDADTQLAGVRRSLRELTGEQLPPGTELEAPEATCKVEDATRVDASAVQRPEFAVLGAQQQVLTAREEASQAPDRPRLAAFAQAGLGRPGLNMLNDELQPFFIGGLRVTVPLSYLYTGTHRAAHEQLAAERALVERQKDALMAQINVELAQHRAELERLDATVALDGELVGVRARARAQTEAQLALGTATMTDLIGDLTQEDQARTRLAIHRHQRSLACQQLALTLGKP